MDSHAVSVDSVKFSKIYDQAGHTALVDLNVDGTTTKVLIKDVQLDPVRGTPIHASFHKVNLKEKIQAQVPVEIIGEEENPLVKSGDALVLVLLNEITVESLPSDIPQVFTVDVSKIAEVGDGITIAALEFDKSKVELVEYEEDAFIVKLDHATMEETEEEVDEAAAIAGLEATEEKKEEEGAEEEAKE